MCSCKLVRKSFVWLLAQKNNKTYKGSPVILMVVSHWGVHEYKIKEQVQLLVFILAICENSNHGPCSGCIRSEVSTVIRLRYSGPQG